MDFQCGGLQSILHTAAQKAISSFWETLWWLPLLSPGFQGLGHLAPASPSSLIFCCLPLSCSVLPMLTCFQFPQSPNVFHLSILVELSPLLGMRFYLASPPQPQDSTQGCTHPSRVTYVRMLLCFHCCLLFFLTACLFLCKLSFQERTSYNFSAQIPLDICEPKVASHKHEILLKSHVWWTKMSPSFAFHSVM